jgi:hypothetical protein
MRLDFVKILRLKNKLQSRLSPNRLLPMRDSGRRAFGYRKDVS